MTLKKVSVRQNKFEKVEQLSSNEKLLNGTAWLSMGNMISRIIGAVYIIPWAIWIGSNYEIANGLYAIAYSLYALFLDISSAGFPMAITKQISQLNAKNEYQASFKLFKHSLIIMILTGLISASIFYFTAFLLASWGPNPTGNTADKIIVLKSLAPALLILPPLSLLRGFFQGYQQMTTPAVSQVLEQVVRVIYMLTTTYYIMKILNGSLVDAVVHSTFAAFIGALVALLFLLFELFKERHYFMSKLKFSKTSVSIDFKDSLKTMLKDSIPFVLMGGGTSLLAIIDQFVFEKVMKNFSDFSNRDIAVAFSWFSANASKLTSIVGSLTISVAIAAVPSIAALYLKNNRKEFRLAISKNLQFYAFVVLPATGGLFVVSDAIYRVFYKDNNGAGVLRSLCFVLISMGLFSMFASILQGMGKHKIALKGLSILLLAKIIFDILATAAFHEYGPAISSFIASIIAIFYLWKELHYLTKFNQIAVLRRTLLILLATFIMMVVAFIFYLLLEMILPEYGFISNLIKVLITALIGGLTYVIITIKFGLAQRFMPRQVAKISHKLHIK